MDLDKATEATEELINYLIELRIIIQNNLNLNVSFDVSMEKLWFYIYQTVELIEDNFYYTQFHHEKIEVFWLKINFPVLFKCYNDIHSFKKFIWDSQSEEEDPIIFPEIKIHPKEVKDWISSQPMTEQEKKLFSKYGLILKTNEQRKLF